jgi:small-conductance mechanosensitive channel
LRDERLKKTTKMTALRMIVLATILIVGNIVEVSGQTPPTLPPGMTQAQFDALVDAIGKAVADKLKNEGAIATPRPAPAPPPAAGNVVADQLAAFVDKAEHVLQGAPVLGANLAAITSLLDESNQGGRSVRRFFLLLAVAAGVSLAAEPILRKSLGVFRRRLASGTAPERGLASLVNLGLLVLLDGLGVLAVWIIVTGELGVLFPGYTGQDRLAAAVLTGLFRWRLFVLGFRVLLQPDLPAARLCTVPDRDARVMYTWLSVVVFVMIVGVILTGVAAAIHSPPDAVSTARVIMAPLVVVVFLWFVVQSENAVRHWCNGLTGAPRVYRFIGDHWIAVAAPFFLLMGAALIYGAVSELADVGAALRLTIGLIVGLLIFETLLGALLQRVDSALPGRTPASDAAKLPDVLARCLRVAVLIGVGVALANAWAVNVLGLVDASQWNALSLEMRTAGATLFVGFVIWELLKFVTDPYVVPKAGMASKARGSSPALSPHASRLSTLVPLLRAALGIVIALVAVLIVLADLGVNITPLLAGASILGLAVSFGSQALVKDIVSGIFYLTDDAFRVGEYIECGQTRGIVEGFTLRSIRLRHPSGQLHTIPFGDLGKIANFSRDWAIVKYDFSFPRDADIDKVRSAVEGIDSELRRDPDYGRKILEPLKTQGVVGITDNALVIQFRFAAEPGNPEVIQREVMHRLMHAFQDQGIEFGSATAVS